MKHQLGHHPLILSSILVTVCTLSRLLFVNYLLVRVLFLLVRLMTELKFITAKGTPRHD